ncbi:hypothetical protein M501DRAFT_1002772 [Patellaria atrata CBS 101060]|uniref:Uncharacterized protein n=1 Tax=Patellaria atrata CBS 101060 TaxID=1346257 RepID=A0A9P4VR01_9PEZI|nr:hypothetical protein M501DRAFT_1002772 [Patellaria atrata CBS 101060]
MTDLLNVLPDFGTSPFAHLLPSLDKSLVTVSDILTLDVVDVAKRAQLPSAEVQKLAHAILAELHSQYEPTRSDHASDNIASVGAVAPSLYKLGLNDAWDTISTLDDQLDTVLGGGISPGYVVEITGER